MTSAPTAGDGPGRPAGDDFADPEPGPTPPVRSTWTPDRPPNLLMTLAPLRRGSLDPTFRRDEHGIWRTCRTPEGPATLLLRQRASGAVEITGWGPGADWAVGQVPELAGTGDDWADFDCSAHPLLRESRHRAVGLRLPRTGLVFEVLVPTILEQRVIGTDARRGWRYLVTRYGDPAPGPAPQGMRVIPAPETWRLIPSWEWHAGNIDPGRGRTVLRAARVADGLERTVHRGWTAAEVVTALRSLPGIGVWTAAEVVQRSHGDPDTVSVGDYHLSALVGWALIGKPVDDDGMLELLEPWLGHRQRVVRLIEVSGFRKPRFGPRLDIQDYRNL